MKVYLHSFYTIYIVSLFIFLYSFTGISQTSTLLGYDASGHLTYQEDAKGNHIPDFSYTGYHHGEKEIPVLPVVKTISPVNGDNHAHIQNAIREIEARTPNAMGYRGALLLKEGEYPIGDILSIQKSGVVVRGEGTNTILVATKRVKQDFIRYEGSGAATPDLSTRTKIADTYVPVGTQQVTLVSGHSFKVGDRIFLERKPNQAWIDLLGTGNLKDTDPDDTNWTPQMYTIRYKRVITGINGDQITFDAPVVDMIDSQYAEGYVYTYTWDNRIEEVGIENMRLASEFDSDTDEDHAWDAVKFINAENAWAKDVTAYYFGYSCVNVTSTSSKISVFNCKMMDPKSRTTGGRKYSFNTNGEQTLFKNCYARGGRHDYVTGSRTPGPNTFVNCISENQKSTTGPHHRWGTGQLYDNVSGTKDFAAENRRNSGSGHGWAGAQIMFWNCTTTTKFVIQDPPGDHVNWAIGCKGTVTATGQFGATDPLGYVESNGTFLQPASLYEKQLQDRLNVLNVSEEDFSFSPELKVYPNPATHILYISNNKERLKWTLYNVLGNQLHTGDIDKISLQQLTPGFYVLKFENGMNRQFIKL